LGQLGLEMIVSSVRLRPGKPTWFGRLADGRRVLGLPGNPASAMVAAELFLRPLLMAWQGAEPDLTVERARLSTPLPGTGPREQWMRAHLSTSADGVQVVTPFSDQDSSLVSVFARSNALLRRPEGAPVVEAGAVVDVIRLDRL
jgi:molybdopterin molybdotransferase